MPHDELRELEKARRKALWALASLYPSDPEASGLLPVLDHIDAQKQGDTPSTDKPLTVRNVRDAVPNSITIRASILSSNTTYPNRGENASSRQASDQPGLLMARTPPTGRSF